MAYMTSSILGELMADPQIVAIIIEARSDPQKTLT